MASSYVKVSSPLDSSLVPALSQGPHDDALARVPHAAAAVAVVARAVVVVVGRLVALLHVEAVERGRQREGQLSVVVLARAQSAKRNLTTFISRRS